MTDREYNECVSANADNVYRFILKTSGMKKMQEM